jgi:tRNA (guanine10-N2)-dimethyltransferase
METHNHLYFLTYDDHESELSKLESKYLFKIEDTNKLILSDIKVEPSSSAFVKERLDIIAASEDYATLISEIKDENIEAEGFKVEYIVLKSDKTPYTKQLEKVKDIGYIINGIPNYKDPNVTYGLCFANDVWYFGIRRKDKFDWQKHKQKPRSFSNSININIAKALVNIASKGDKTVKLLDACCGVGTIMLEACFAGFTIEGCDINWKICKNARANLEFFNYKAVVHHSDIEGFTGIYDAAVIDLPYNLYSPVNDNSAEHIIQSVAKLATRLIIVSIIDVASVIQNVGYNILEKCAVGKSGKTKFERTIWVCEK